MTCKCFLDPQWQPEGSYKLVSVRPSICLGVFFELYHCFFLNFGMVLETHMRLYVTGLDFLGIFFFFFTPKIRKNGPKTGFFEFIEKFGHQFLLNLFYNENILFAVFLHKSRIWENFCSWGMGQNVLSQSDCTIFKSTISPEQIAVLQNKMIKNFLILHGQKWV